MTVEDAEELVEYELRLSDSKTSRTFVEIPRFFSVTVSTFLTEPRLVLPTELYHLQPVKDTLTLSTTVI